MAKYIVIVYVLGFCSCISMQAPSDFSYLYDGKDTNLAKRINIEGYYVSQRDCDSTFYSVFMFYPDGLFAIASTKQKPKELINCFEHGGKSKICQYVEWGTYRLENDTIKTQTIRDEGVAKCTIFRDYQIQTTGALINVSDFVRSENTDIGYMKKYPSYTKSVCKQYAVFYPLTTKRNRDECPLLKKKWFYSKK